MKHIKVDIKVDSCKHCLLRNYNFEDKVNLCEHPETSGTEIEDIKVTPSWCRLEDAPGLSEDQREASQ